MYICDNNVCVLCMKYCKCEGIVCLWLELRYYVLMRLMNSATKMKFAGNQKNMPSGLSGHMVFKVKWMGNNPWIVLYKF